MKHLIVFWLFLGAVGLAHARPDVEEAGSARFRISVKSPAYGFCRQGQPMTAIVSVTNSTAELKGFIEVWLDKKEAACICRQAFSIGKGRFRFFLYPQPPDSQPERLNVVARDTDGRILASTWLPLNPLQNTWWIAAVGFKERKFSRDSLSAIKPAVLPVRDTGMLPDHWYGYRMFDALFWDGQQTAKLTAAQQAAMTEWIMTGGRLVIMSREGDRSIRSPIPKVFPHMRQLPHETLFPDQGISALFSSLGFIRHPNSPFSEKVVGLGSVVLLHRDYSKLPLLTKKEALPLLGYPANFSGDLMSKSANLDYDHDSMQTIISLRTELASAAGYHSIPFTPILVLMIAYIVFVSILDLLVLKKMRRLPCTWLTFPVLIGLFSLISFIMFYKGKTGSEKRYDLYFEDVGPDGNGRTCALTCMRKPSSKPLHFAVPGNHYLDPLDMQEFNNYRYYYGYDPENESRTRTVVVGTREIGGSTDIALPGHMGAFKFFSEEYPAIRDRPPFSCSLTYNTKYGMKGTFTKDDTVPDTFTGFILFRNCIYDLNPAERKVIPERRSVFHSSPGYYYGSGYRRTDQPSGHKMKEALQKWTENSIDTITMTSFMYYAGTIPSIWHRDEIIFRHTTHGRTAVLYAFYKEESNTAALPYKRIKCVRQIVRVKEEGSLNNEPSNTQY